MGRFAKRSATRTPPEPSHRPGTTAPTRTTVRKPTIPQSRCLARRSGSGSCSCQRSAKSRPTGTRPPPGLCRCRHAAGRSLASHVQGPNADDPHASNAMIVGNNWAKTWFNVDVDDPPSQQVPPPVVPQKPSRRRRPIRCLRSVRHCRARLR